MGTRKMMKLVDAYDGRMVCKVCGSEHLGNRRKNSDGGGFMRGAWQCVNNDDAEHQRFKATGELPATT